MPKMPPENYYRRAPSTMKLKNTKLIYRNILHFYTLIINNKKII